MNQWKKHFTGTSRILIHLLFWGALGVLGLSVFIIFLPVVQALAKLVMAGVFLTTIFYTNVLWLMPNYFAKRQFKQYALYVAGGILVISLFRTWLEPQFLPEFDRPFRADIPIKVGGILLYFLPHIAIWMVSCLYFLLDEWLFNYQIQAQAKREKLETELRLLKWQIHPHFLLNTLNNLYSLVYFQDPKAAPLLMQLSELLRYMLYECQDEQVPLEKEIAFLRHYMAIQTVKADWETDVYLKVTGVTGMEKIPPFLLLVFFENAFKHGDVLNKKTGFIHAKLTCFSPNKLQFEMENSISPQPPIASDLNSGIGLENVRQRLALLYPNCHQLTLDQGNGVYRVKLELL